MFGLGDIWVSLAFVLSILSVAVCVIYGVINWNKGQDSEMQQINEEIKWQAEDGKFKDDF